jgi:hypothetical protein
MAQNNNQNLNFNIDIIRSEIQNKIDYLKSISALSCKLNNHKIFLDSIKDKIKEMMVYKLSYGEQLKIINESSNFDIKYDEYLYYMKKYFFIKTSKQINKKQNTDNQKNEIRKKFSHEAMPDPTELY